MALPWAVLMPTMASVPIACPYCGQRIEVDTSWIGQNFNCPSCSGLIAMTAQGPAVTKAGDSFTPQNSYEKAVYEAAKRHKKLEQSAYSDLSLDGKVEKYLQGGAKDSTALRMLPLFLAVFIPILLISIAFPPAIFLAVVAFSYFIFKAAK